MYETEEDGINLSTPCNGFMRFFDPVMRAIFYEDWLSFQLHVMDSVIEKGESPAPEEVLSTPCNGFVLT